MLFPAITASSLGLLGLLQATTAQPQCRRVTFNVTATAENLVYADMPDLSDSAAIRDYVRNGIANGPVTRGTSDVTGTYEIVGHYCQPSACTRSKGVLQYLMHGAGYNQTLWTGLGLGDEYDWIRSATSQGYHTFTVDRLGHGENPDRPDPWSVLQIPFQAEVNHQILSAIRNDAGNPLRQAFDTVILVGHSYGSSLGVNLLRQHPEDADAFVMTGWSTLLSANATIELDYVPASDVYPDRLHGLAKGYLACRTEKARRDVYYAGDFDASIPAGDFLGGDTVGVGEILSIRLGLEPAAQFTGPVLAVMGEKDALLCNPQFGSCSEIMDATGSLFPAARNYQYHIAPHTGHDLSLHYSAPHPAARVSEWLESGGFKPIRAAGCEL